VLLFDQRGCGRSTPHASLDANTNLAPGGRHRDGCAAERCENGWSSAARGAAPSALAYAQTHPEHVSELILRGIFTVRPEELRWYYQEGASWIFPDEWEHFLAPIPPEERSDLMAGLPPPAHRHRPSAQLEAAVA
jgi:proline iminopeptidase